MMGFKSIPENSFRISGIEERVIKEDSINGLAFTC
jgi:hypothetical protein